jgi:peptide/nickel transport system ATP-binding protein
MSTPHTHTQESGTVDTVFELRDVSVSFPMDRGRSRVLDDISLDVRRGEVLAVVGESGSGKSMFADSLLDAVVRPGTLSGEITYYPPSGEEIALLDLSRRELKSIRWEHVSMVFQGAMSSFNPTMTIGEHFRETLDAHDYGIGPGMDRARQLLSDVYLDPDRVLGSYPHELSGGMKQRTLIALSLVLEPEVLVMDEPTAALDLLMQRSILELIEDLRRKYDLTIVFITHDLPLVAELADRIAVMYAFEFVEVGPTERVVRDAAHPYTRSLLSATPNLDAPVTEMRPIEGSSPDPVDPPSGCSYHPRCPLANERCVEADPGFERVSAGHETACFHWERSAEAVPFDPAVSDGSTGDGSVRPKRALDRPETAGESLLTLDSVAVHFEEETGLLDWFSDPEVVKAVDGVSLEIERNDVVALVGESGCGKTTLGKAAIGLRRPTGGSVRYRGQDVWEARDGRDPEIPHEEIRRSLQIIHQDPGSSLNPNRKVLSTLAAPLKKWEPGLSDGDRRARILGMLETVGMAPPEDYADRYPHQLSGGEKQRVALVRSMLLNPDLILADEAISALDVSLRVEMMDLMLDLQERFGTSFLMISHDLSNARYFAENAGGRIGVMYMGRIVEIGSPEEIIHDPKHPYTKVLRWATATLDPSDRGAVPVRRIDVPDPKDPPSGCRFHTRCPEAREVCRREVPDLDSGDRRVACFRDDPTHPYWESDPVED